MVDVLFCADKRALRHFAVSATSLAINLPRCIARGFLISSDVEQGDVERLFEWLESEFGLSLSLLKMPSPVSDVFPVSGHISEAAYYRLFMGVVLPPEVETVLYLDSDLVVDGEMGASLLEEAEKLRRGTEVLAATPDAPGNGAHLTATGIVRSAYFQSGVMLIDMRRWREVANVELFTSIAQTHRGRIRWWDQDVLNIALQGRWRQLPQHLNGTPNRRSSETSIYHFAGRRKPWTFLGKPENIEIYEKYRKQTRILRPPRIDFLSIVEHYRKAFKKSRQRVTK